MKIEIENIYSILPFNNDVKLNIYTQLYKGKHLMVTDEFKNELKYYLKYKDIVLHYKNIFDGRDTDYTYRLLEDFIFYFHKKSIKDSNCKIFKDSIFNSFFQIMNSNMIFMSPKIRLHYSKHIWNYMNTGQRQYICSMYDSKIFEDINLLL